MRVWSDAGMGWEVSVNIAAPHFHRPNFVQRLKELVERPAPIEIGAGLTYGAGCQLV